MFVRLHLFALDFIICFAPCRGRGSAPPVLPTKPLPAGGAEPRPYNLPRKKVTFTKISIAPSIDGNCSKATSYKLDAPVSGGAYQDARKVTLVWNARPKHWDPPEFRGRMHPASPSTLFSPIFSLAREKIGPPEATGSRKSATTSQSRLRRASIPTPFVPSGHFPLIGGIGPWEGSLTYEKERLPWEAAPCF